MTTPQSDKKRHLQIEFGRLVRLKRHALQLTQQELAEKAHLDATYISSIERGERNVSLGNIFSIAEALNMSPKELIPSILTDEKTNTREEFARLLLQIRTQKKITQKELASKVEMSVSMIAQYESGERDIHLHDLFLIAKALGVSVKELIPSNSLT